MKLAILKRDVTLWNRAGEEVVVNKGATVQVEQFFLGSYMGYTIHAPGGMIESISGGFVNECLEFLDDETSKA